MRLYREAAQERAMKVQEVILRAMAKRITWWQAAEIIGISVRSMRRWKWRYEQHGIHLSYTWVKRALQGAGLVHQRRQRGPHRKRRPRRPLPGMLLHVDGSRHRAGSATTAGMTCWWCWTTPPARFTTRSWWSRNRPARCCRRCARWSNSAACSARFTATGPVISF